MILSSKLDSEYINKVEMAQSLLMGVICMKTDTQQNFHKYYLKIHERVSEWCMNIYNLLSTIAGH